MSNKKLQKQFLEVSDALSLGNPAIPEKDYYVVQLLHMLTNVQCDNHRLVFSGGTALAKSSIKILRMSEDVDIKLIPTEKFEGESKNAKRKMRKAYVDSIINALNEHPLFTYTQKTVRDDYRYAEVEIEYPQQHVQAPCLRPYIKLEFMETIELNGISTRPISSLVAELYKLGPEVSAMDCVSIEATTVEKVLSMTRRTMSVKRNPEARDDDETLVRHIYDVHCIANNHTIDMNVLKPLFIEVMEEDRVRYGRQHAEFADNPKEELKQGLVELETDTKFRERFEQFVKPMVYNTEPHDFDTCFDSFKSITHELLA
ncbi:nucleotidyl transferase AbiEii/AbiGii toxin family protein [Vibrio owensii]|uniref:nucleotidyl transferase AbiEii/AbiGii toxin family protein n=1 Tax=Vibrio owensii TaxID=696485 RepID=UPI004067D4FA